MKICRILSKASRRFLFTILILGLLASACNSSMKTGERISFSEVEGYFFQGDGKETDSIQVIVIRDQASFDRIFGIAKTMDNEVSQIDFSNRLVAALILPESHSELTISVQEIRRDKDIAICHYKISKGDSLSYTMRPIKILSLPNKGIENLKLKLVKD